MTQPLVSVIILNWNGLEHLKDCLPSMTAQNYENLEIIVVDNGSTDGSIEYIQKEFPDTVTLIRNAENVGFCIGNNIGIEVASGEYLVVLNNDTELDANWISALVDIAEKHPDVGMFASKILSFYDRDKIDCVGHLIYPDGLSRGRGRGETDNGQYDQIEEVIFPSGCAAFYRKAMLDEIGLFDEQFFIYVEDSDLGMRGRLAGWKCLYVPQAIVYHKYSATMGGYSPQKAYLVERNRIWSVVKTLPLSMLITSFYYTFVRYVLNAYGAMFGSGASGQFTREFSKRALVFTLLKSYQSALLGMLAMLKKRRQIKKKTKVTNKQIRQWYKKFGISAREITLKV